MKKEKDMIIVRKDFLPRLSILNIPMSSRI